MEHLTESELQIMKCLWDEEEQLALSEILKKVNERYHKGWKPQTASTFVARLVQKGYLKLNRSVRYYSYEVCIPETEYLDQEILRFAEFWGESISSRFIAKLMEQGMITAEEREKLREILL